jgi:hypothetical protein
MSGRELRFTFLIAALACGLVSMLLKEGERRKAAAFFVGWLVPGAGHVLLGKWRKGLFFFAVLAAIWLFGNWIVGFKPVSFDDNPFYYVGQYGSAATFLLSQALPGGKAYPRQDLELSWFDPGLLYVCVAGLLNLVVMLNVLEVRLPAAAPAPEKPAEPAPAAPPPAPEKTA